MLLTVPSLERRSLHGAELEELIRNTAPFVFLSFSVSFPSAICNLDNCHGNEQQWCFVGSVTESGYSVPQMPKTHTKTEEEKKQQSCYIFNRKSVLIFIIFIIIIRSRLLLKMGPITSRLWTFYSERLLGTRDTVNIEFLSTHCQFKVSKLMMSPRPRPLTVAQ